MYLSSYLMIVPCTIATVPCTNACVPYNKRPHRAWLSSLANYEWFCDISVYPNVLGVYLRPISRGCNIPQPASQLRKARTLQIHDPVWEAGKSGTPKSWQVDSDKNVEWDESSGKNLGSFCQKWVETKCFDQNKVGLHGLHPFFINLFLTKQGWGHSQP